MEFKRRDVLTFDSGRQVTVEDVKEGGMGLVYICQPGRYSTTTAFKTFKKQYFDENKAVLNSFLKECNTWISLGTHPFICAADRVESINGQPFVEMRSYKNNLGYEIINNKLPKRVKAVMRLALEICLAMVHAGKKIEGFVHRDLKPNNILLGLTGSPVVNATWQDEEELFKGEFFPPWGHAVVTDFGLSKVISELQNDIPSRCVSVKGLKTFLFSKAGKICGTPPYMSPEQCVGRKLDKRSDIYSFGCVLFEMLTGYLVFPARSGDEFIYHHIHSKPPDIKRINPRVPLDFANIITKCLEKKPRHRFTDFMEIYSDIRNTLPIWDKLDKFYNYALRGIFRSSPTRKADDQRLESEAFELLYKAYKFYQLKDDKKAH